MRYIGLNLGVLAILVFTICIAEQQEQQEPPREYNENYEPDWDQTIRDLERDAEAHNSYDRWGVNI